MSLHVSSVHAGEPEMEMSSNDSHFALGHDQGSLQQNTSCISRIIFHCGGMLWSCDGAKIKTAISQVRSRKKIHGGKINPAEAKFLNLQKQCGNNRQFLCSYTISWRDAILGVPGSF